MEKPLRVILIEDDAETCKKFSECAEKIEEIELCAVTNNSYRALELVRENMPEAIILDLELNEGKGSGILFLQGLKDVEIDFKPFILITTNNLSNTMHEYSRQLGADFIMSKYQSDYSEETPMEFLRKMKDILQNNAKKQYADYATTESTYEHNKRLERMVIMELDCVGISPKALGYKYLTDAILYTIKDEGINIYSEIGKKYDKTDSSVERAMQNAINKAWRTYDIDELLKHYTARISSEKGVPTLTEFIYYYARKIKGNS